MIEDHVFKLKVTGLYLCKWMRERLPFLGRGGMADLEKGSCLLPLYVCCNIEKFLDGK